MAVTGDISRWSYQFPNSFVPKIMTLILDSWKSVNTVQTCEVPITQEFFVVLNRNQQSSYLPFLIDLEIILPEEEGIGQKGRLDIRFIHGFRRQVYFSFECKRLRWVFPRGQFDSLAGVYVTKGMYRYFDDQYAQDLDKGGMLGYVMDGNIDEAIKDVQKAIEKRRSSLYMQENETLKASSCITSKQVKETFHKYGPTQRFTLYHIFLPMNIAPNNN